MPTLKTTSEKFFSGVRTMFGTKKKKSVFDDASFYGGSKGSNNFKSEKSQLRAYEQIAWVSVAVDQLSRDAGSPEYNFINNKTGEVLDDAQIPTDIKLPFDNGFAGLPFQGGLMPTVVAHRALTGNAYFLMAQKSAYGAVNNVIEQFIPLDPSKVSVKLNESATAIVSYDIELGQKSYTVPPESILHFKQSTILTPFKGIGNISKMRITIEGEFAGDEFYNEFMKRRATPSLFIKDEEPRNPDEFKRTIELLRQSYEGMDNAGRLMFLSGKGVDAKVLQISQKDMQFLEAKAFSRQTILSVFGVPPSIAGIPDGVSVATAQVFKLTYLENTINPILRELEGTINMGFVWKKYPDISLQFKKYSTGDLTSIKDMIANAIITPARGAELMGEDADFEDEGLNSFYMPSGFMPINGAVTPPATPPATPAPVTPPTTPTQPEPGKHVHGKNCGCNDYDEKSIDDICKAFEAKVKPSRRFQAQFLRMALLRRKVLVRKYEEKMGKYFEGQKNRVIERIKEFMKNNPKEVKFTVSQMISFVFDTGAEDEALTKTVQDLHTSGVTGAVSDVNALTGGSTASTMANPWIKKAVSRGVATLIKTHALNEVSQDKLKDMVGDWLNGDQNIMTLTDDVSAMYADWEGYRARRIARTESRIAQDNGAAIAYKDQGVEFVDVVGCEQFEPDSDCGRTGVPIDQADSLTFHPNHQGAIVPGEKVENPDA